MLNSLAPPNHESNCRFIMNVFISSLRERASGAIDAFAPLPASAGLRGVSDASALLLNTHTGSLAASASSTNTESTTRRPLPSSLMRYP